jgi:hypothetical protein
VPSCGKEPGGHAGADQPGWEFPYGPEFQALTFMTPPAPTGSSARQGCSRVSEDQGTADPAPLGSSLGAIQRGGVKKCRAGCVAMACPAEAKKRQGQFASRPFLAYRKKLPG